MGVSGHVKPARASTVWRFALLCMILSAIAWLGSAGARILIGNDLLQPGTLEFDQYLPPEAEREIYRLLSVVTIAMLSGYVITLVSSIVFLASSPWKFKEQPWLLMSAILFYLFVPVEIFTMVLDVRIVYTEFFTTADNAVFRELFLARVGALAGAPLVAMMSYLTIIGIAVFQPFRNRHGDTQA
jgi:hypothetical protein